MTRGDNSIEGVLNVLLESNQVATVPCQRAIAAQKGSTAKK